LGHGAFALRHTFSEKNLVSLPQGKTDNLMDYAKGNGLLKYQWDLIHDPQRPLFAWTEEMVEGASILNLVDQIRNINLNGGNRLLLSKLLSEKDKFSIVFKTPQNPTEIETLIKKYDIYIDTRNYKKELKNEKNELWINFVSIDNTDDIVATIIVKDIAKEQDIIEYMRLFDIYVKGDVEYMDGKIVAYISEEPQMPQLELIFNCETGEEITLSYTLSYDIKYKYKGKEYTFTDFYEKRNVKFKGNSYTIPWNDIFQGGDLKIKWEVDNQEKEMAIMVRGKNSEINKVKQYGNTVGCGKYWFFWDIVGRESTNRQFMDKGVYCLMESKTYDGESHKKEQKGLPLWGGPKGFGFAQLDNWGSITDPKVCNTLQRWNWKENIKGSIELIESKINEISSRKDLNNIITTMKIKNDSVIMNDLVVGNVTFTLANSPLFPKWDIKKTLPSGKRSIFDANLIKYYNGGFLLNNISRVKEETLNMATGKKEEKTYYKVIIEGTEYLEDVYKK